jgi:hypothetical protein
MSALEDGYNWTRAQRRRDYLRNVSVRGRSPRLVASSRLAAASRRSWIGALTAASTMRPRSWRPSAPGCGTRSTWTPSRPSCWRWLTGRCSRQGLPSGSDPRHKPGRLVKDTEAHAGRTRLDPLHAMQFRAVSMIQVSGPAPSVTAVSESPWLTAGYRWYRCLWHASGTAGEDEPRSSVTAIVATSTEGEAHPWRPLALLARTEGRVPARVAEWNSPHHGSSPESLYGRCRALT